MRTVSETSAKFRRELTKKALVYINFAHTSGNTFVRRDAFEGDKGFDQATLTWSCGLFKRLKREGVLDVNGSAFNPRYRALRTFQIDEDVISDYATTTTGGFQNVNRREPPFVRYGEVVSEAAQPNGQQHEAPRVPPQEAAEEVSVDGAEPDVREMLAGFLTLLPALVPAIQRIEARQTRAEEALRKMEERAEELTSRLSAINVQLSEVMSKLSSVSSQLSFVYDGLGGPQS